MKTELTTAEMEMVRAAMSHYNNATARSIRRKMAAAIKRASLMEKLSPEWNKEWERWETLDDEGSAEGMRGLTKSELRILKLPKSEL